MIFRKQYRSYNKRGAFKHFDGAAFLMEFVADGTVNPEVLDALAKEALSVSAGSRLIRSRLRVLCEDFLFDNPYARSIELDVRPAMDM